MNTSSAPMMAAMLVLAAVLVLGGVGLAFQGNIQF